MSNLIGELVVPVYQNLEKNINFVGRLSEDYSGEEGGTKLLHITDDQRLYGKSDDSQPTSDSQGQHKYYLCQELLNVVRDWGSHRNDSQHVTSP